MHELHCTVHYCSQHVSCLVVKALFGKRFGHNEIFVIFVTIFDLNFGVLSKFLFSDVFFWAPSRFLDVDSEFHVHFFRARDLRVEKIDFIQTKISK